MIAVCPGLSGISRRGRRVREDGLCHIARLCRLSADRDLYDDARTVEGALLRALHDLKPGRKLETNVEF